MFRAMTDFPRPIARERIAAFPRDRGSEDILDVSKHYQKGAGQRCLQKANGLRQTGERVQWPGQGDLGWDLRMVMSPRLYLGRLWRGETAKAKHRAMVLFELNF